MKFFLLISALALSLTHTLGQTEPDNNLSNTFNDLSIGPHQTLVDLHPELKSAIDSSSITDDCYNSRIGPNEYVDIFRDGIQSIVETYFKVHHGILDHSNTNQIKLRVKALIDSVRRIALLALNCQAKKPENRTRWGLTSMSAYTVEEFRGTSKEISNTILRQNHHALNNDTRCSLEPLDGEAPLPDRFNWLENGVNLTVYHQSNSGWCAIFSSVSAIEAAVQISKRSQPDMYDYRFSQMAIGACNTKNIDEGMHVETVMEYAISHGLTNYSDAPFPWFPETTPCEKYPIIPNIKVKDYCAQGDLTNDLKEDDLRRLTYRNGPSVVVIDCSAELRVFAGDIFNGNCSQSYNHAVLLLGWDENNWILQNSHGDSFGTNGRFRLPRGQNKCGVQTFAASVLM